MLITWVAEPESHPLWPQMYAALNSAADRGNGDAWAPTDWVFTAVENKTILGICAVRERDDGNAEIMNIAGTRFREWLGPLDEVLSAWARENGAERFINIGRKGWARAAGHLGWVCTGESDGMYNYEKVL